MKSSRRPRPMSMARLCLFGLALSAALIGCRGEEQDGASEGSKPATAQEGAPSKAKQAEGQRVKAQWADAQQSESQKAGAPPAGAPKAEGQPGEAKSVDTPEAHAELVGELAESRKQALAKQEPVDPETAKRMKDPEYRKQKDAMLSQLSQVSTEYFQEGIEIRHTRRRPEWRLIDPSLAQVTDPAQRRKKGEELALRFKEKVEPILEKTIAVKVYADASESVEIY